MDRDYNEFRRDMDAVYTELERNKDRMRDFPELGAMIGRVLQLCEDAKPSVAEINARSSIIKPSALEIERWKRGQDSDYRIQLEIAKRENDDLTKRLTAHESYVIDESIPMAVNIAMSDPNLAKVPFVYYGFNTRRLVYTPATLDFLEVEEVPKSLSLGRLLGYIKRKNSEGENVKKGMVLALKKGEHLHYKQAETTTGKNIYLTTHPYHFSRQDQRVVGMGISFNDPGLTNIGRGWGLKRLHQAISGCISYVSDSLSGRDKKGKKKDS